MRCRPRSCCSRAPTSSNWTGILVDDWSDERLKHEEDRFFIGFHVGGDKTPEVDPGDGLGLVLPTAGCVATAVPEAAESPVQAARPTAARRPAATKPAEAVVTVPQAAPIAPARRGARIGDSDRSIEE